MLVVVVVASSRTGRDELADGVRTILPVSEPMTRALSRQLFDTLRSELQELGEDLIGEVGNPDVEQKVTGEAGRGSSSADPALEERTRFQRA